MDLMRDALELLLKTGVQASGKDAVIFAVPTEPHGTYFIREPDGKITRHDKTFQSNVKALDIETVVRWSIREAVGTQLWYCRSKVQARSSDTPVHRCTFDLKSSDPFSAIKSWPKTGFRADQRTLHRLFRTVFADCMANHTDILDVIKRVDIKKAQEAAGELTKGRVSMSRSMVAEAAGADKIPDVLRFIVPVYETPNVPVKTEIRVAFELDAQDEVFILTPLPGAVENAEVQGESKLWDMLQGALHGQTDTQHEPGDAHETPVYYGDADQG